MSQIRELVSEEWQVLRALERRSALKSSTGMDALARISGQPADRVSFALAKLNRRGLVRKEDGFNSILTAGLDILALKYYADRNDIAAFGKIIAKGKESDVYEVISESGDLFAIKLFRLGRTSFREVRRKRKEGTAAVHNWIARNYQAARNEFRALAKLHVITDNVPRPVSYNRHTVLLEELLGVRLSERPELRDPVEILRKTLETIREAYVKAGMVNGDLSEYNILTDGAKIWAIDWPQWVTSSDQTAPFLLERDVLSIVRYFLRAYRVRVESDDALRFVRGEKSRLVIRRARSSC